MNIRERDAFKKAVSTTVVVCTVLGAVPLVGGLAAIFLNFRYRYRESVWGPSVSAFLGLLLIVVAVLSENPGPYQRTLRFVRNALMILLCAAVLLALLLILIGPLH